MKTLLLDRTSWDLCLDANGNIAVASEPYAIAQDAASACRLFKGEAWYNTAKGIPYFGQILGYAPTPLLVKTFLQTAAQSVPGALSVTVFLSDLTARSLSGQVQITTSTGEVVTAGF